jgi:hypothetical protein
MDGDHPSLTPEQQDRLDNGFVEESDDPRSHACFDKGAGYEGPFAFIALAMVL